MRKLGSFVQVMRDAKWPTHYLVMTSASGKSRALFFIFYDSFDAWEKDVQAQSKNATLSAALEHAGAADGNFWIPLTRESLFMRQTSGLLSQIWGSQATRPRDQLLPR